MAAEERLLKREDDSRAVVGKRRLTRRENQNFSFPGAPAKLQLRKEDLGPQPNRVYHPSVFHSRHVHGQGAPVPDRHEPEYDVERSIAGQFTMSPKGIRRALRRQRRGSKEGASLDDVETWIHTLGPFELSIYRAQCELLDWLDTTVHIERPASMQGHWQDEAGFRVLSRTPAKLVWDISNPHLRFACHALCRYYNVVSFSRDELVGNVAHSTRRLMTILRPHVSRVHPWLIKDGLEGRSRPALGGLETPPDTGSELESDLEVQSVFSDFTSVAEEEEEGGEEEDALEVSGIRAAVDPFSHHLEQTNDRVAGTTSPDPEQPPKDPPDPPAPKLSLHPLLASPPRPRLSFVHYLFS